MRRGARALIDLLVAAVALVVAAVIVTGGGDWYVKGAHVRVRSVGNPLTILCGLLVLRYLTVGGAPFFGRFGRPSIDDSVVRWLRSARSAVQRIDARTGRRLLVALTAAVIALKLAFAWSAPGFYSGDDVEVHEMTLAALWHRPWPIWQLRNAFFPMVFVYPAQWLAARSGVTDASTFVSVGRTSVAVVSTMGLLAMWAVVRRLMPGSYAYSIAATVLLATNKLHMAFGASELPRPVSTVFVLLAFWSLIGIPRRMGAAIAGILLGIAACFRFSEIVFLVPACTHALVRRGWRETLLLLSVAVSTSIAVIGLADYLYWGTPLASLQSAIDYTLVHRLSSRGYQPPWWYVEVAQWTNPAVFLLALYGTRRSTWVIGLWAWIPLVLLSLLPHKEARYLIPIVPWVVLLATAGLRDAACTALRWFETGERRWAPAALAAALIVGLLHDAGGWRLPRSNADVAMARSLRDRIAPDAVMSVEQAWRIGGSLYFPNQQVRDLDPALLGDTASLSSSIADSTWVVLDRRTARRTGGEALLADRGFAEYLAPEVTASGFRVWNRTAGGR